MRTWSTQKKGKDGKADNQKQVSTECVQEYGIVNL